MFVTKQESFWLMENKKFYCQKEQKSLTELLKTLPVSQQQRLSDPTNTSWTLQQPQHSSQQLQYSSQQLHVTSCVCFPLVSSDVFLLKRHESRFDSVVWPSEWETDMKSCDLVMWQDGVSEAHLNKMVELYAADFGFKFSSKFRLTADMNSVHVLSVKGWF